MEIEEFDNRDFRTTDIVLKDSPVDPDPRGDGSNHVEVDLFELMENMIDNLPEEWVREARGLWDRFVLGLNELVVRELE